MSQSSVQGSVTLRKLRTGATASVSLSSTKQLFQLYTVDAVGNADFAPNWETSGNAPVVSVNVTSSPQDAVSVQSVVWRINNTLATTINGVSAYDSGNTHTLTIGANLGKAGILNFNSGTLSAEISISDESGHPQVVTKTEIIRIQKAVSNGYNVMINANKTYVDETTSASNPTTLAAVLYNGINVIQDPAAQNITFKWYKGTGTASSAGTGATYSITSADDVDGSQLYICRAYDGDNMELDAEGVNVVDNSDTYVITASATQSKGGTAGSQQDNVTSVNVASDNDATTVTFKVAKSDGTSYTGTPSWKAQKMHADTMKLIKQVTDGTTVRPWTRDATASDSNGGEDTYNTKTPTANTVSIDILDADYVSVGSGSEADHDTEVIATATATLQQS